MRAVVAMFVILAIACAPALAAKALTEKEVKAHLLDGGCLSDIFESYWAAEQGEAIVPILSNLLKNERTNVEAASFATSFPLNALWALAHIPSEKALRALEAYNGKSKATAKLAIEGFKLRRSKGDKRAEYGVLLLPKAMLQTGADENSDLIMEIREGQQVRILQSNVENADETEAYGKPSVYEFVELLPTGERGYVQRALGDCFTPFI